MRSFYCFAHTGFHTGSELDDAKSARYIYLYDAEMAIYQLAEGNIITNGLFETDNTLYRMNEEIHEWEEIVAGNMYNQIVNQIEDLKEKETKSKSKPMECSAKVGEKIDTNKKKLTLYVEFENSGLIKVASGDNIVHITVAINDLYKICNENTIVRFVIE